MRYRQAEVEGMPEALPPQPKKTDSWEKTYTCTTITPIYGGGVVKGEIDSEMPIRASAIRGQLRFWWRLLAMHGRDSAPSPEELFREEREIWGGMAEEKQDHSSKVRIRITEVSPNNLKELIKPCAEYRKKADGTFRGMPYFKHDIPAYAMFPAQGGLSRNRLSIETPPSKVLLPGVSFQLRITCPEEYKQSVISAIRWWGSVGGIGARTRRGLGAVLIEGVDALTIDDCSKVEGVVIKVGPKIYQNATDAWKIAVDSLRDFRQSENIGRNPGRSNKRPGRSRWPEPDSVREVIGRHRIKGDGTSFTPVHPARKSFPRAAFGLPIVFHFQGERGDERSDPQDCVLAPADANADRMASPLILKAMAVPGGYVPIALRLPIKHLDELDLVLKNQGGSENQNLPFSIPRNSWWPTESDTAKIKANYPNSPIKNNEGVCAITAFLNYFESEVEKR